MPETEVLEPTSAVEETAVPTTDAPATPEHRAPSAPADEAATTEPAASVSSRSRGPDGRFIKADGTQASEAEHAAIEAAAPSPPPATIPQPAPAQPVGQPFVVRGDGQRIPMPGSTLNATGDLTVSAEHVATYRQLIAEGLAYRGSWRTKEQDYQRQIQEAGAVNVAKAQKYNEASVFLWDIITDPAKLQALVESPERVDLLRDRMAIMLEKHDLKAPRAVEPPKADPQVEQQQLETAARAVLQDVVEELLESPQAKAIYATDEERTEATKWYLRHLATYATEREDGWAIDTDLVKQDVEHHLKQESKARQAAANAAKAHEFNAKRNAPPVAPPPVVSTKGPGSTGQPVGKTYETREDWRKSMGMS